MSSERMPQAFILDAVYRLIGTTWSARRAASRNRRGGCHTSIPYASNETGAPTSLPTIQASGIRLI